MASKKKATENNKTQAEVYPIVKDGRFVCSDGTEFSDGYFAREYEKSLKQ